jgi:hypothetical protein
LLVKGSLQDNPAVIKLVHHSFYIRHNEVLQLRHIFCYQGNWISHIYDSGIESLKDFIWL